MPTVQRYIGWPGAIELDPGEGASKWGPKDTVETEMEQHIIKTMPVLSMVPVLAEMETGLEIYKVGDAWDEYIEYMGAQNIYFKKPLVTPSSISIMYQNISPFGETYNNSFSQSPLLAGLSQGISQNLQDVMFITGKTGVEHLENIAKGTGPMAGMAQAGQAVVDQIKGMAGRLGGDAAKGVVDLLLRGDHKIDFPMMWRTSGFSTSYEVTTRLYNPFPDNDILYGDLIVAPLAAILGFVLPRSDDGKTYKWPFMCRFSIPGMIRSDASFVQNVSVVKGGDVNDTAWNYRPNIVDVRISLAPVYSTMLMSKVESGSESPTLKKEVKNMMDRKKPEPLGELLPPPIAPPADIQLDPPPPPRILKTPEEEAAAAIALAERVAQRQANW